MPPHFTNLACWSANQLAKRTQTHLLEFEVNVCTSLNPHCQIKGWKTFWQEANSRKPNKVLVKLGSLRATNSCHDGCMFTHLNKFLKDLHVDWLADLSGIWLLDILGRWFPADKSFLMVADSGQSELASSRSGLDWIEAVFRSRSLHDLRFHVHTLVWGIPTQSQRGSPRRINGDAFNWRRPLQVLEFVSLVSHASSFQVAGPGDLITIGRALKIPLHEILYRNFSEHHHSKLVKPGSSKTWLL